jgi:hypothetical protein
MVFEAWSLTLREEHRLRVFENMAMRKYLSLRRGNRRMEKTT